VARVVSRKVGDYFFPGLLVFLYKMFRPYRPSSGKSIFTFTLNFFCYLYPYLGQCLPYPLNVNIGQCKRKIAGNVECNVTNYLPGDGLNGRNML
jgi:hypothetical protein